MVDYLIVGRVFVVYIFKCRKSSNAFNLFYCEMSLRNCLIVVWVYAIYVIGTCLFLSGYLMKHLVVFQNSSANVHVGSSFSCGDFTSLHFFTDEFIKNLESPTQKLYKSRLKRFDKAVIIIIDALRYDFVLNSSTVSKDDEFYLNKMPVFSRLLKKFPYNAALLELIADPPTTTLQRLKGITTGSLPTFIDISRNFASSEIIEDNLIRQMKKLNKNIIFMGDDTWNSIFPDEFTYSYSYPSFNVKDLDTVDNGILDHIYDEINNNATDILIAHFLGVDHCGHRYGPRHPEMTRKLIQMNNVIKKICSILNNNTILLVLGDHGMTNTGDHGGDSIRETSTALFLFSKSKIVFGEQVNAFPKVSQIDIVPTLSLLLGLPIPFSNLGSTIPFLFSLNFDHPCFDENLDALLGSALAAAENALQIHRYLKSYCAESGDIENSFIKTAEDELKNISRLWKNITNDAVYNAELISKIQKGYKEYTLTIYNLFVKKWATFNLVTIVIGFTLLCFAIFFNVISANQFDRSQMMIISAIMSFTCISTIFFMLFSSYLLFSLIFISCCVFSTVVFLFKTHFVQFILRSVNVQFLILFLLFVCSFSNSFIIYEDHVTSYLLQSLILYKYYPSIITIFKQNFMISKTKSSKCNQRFKCAELLLLMCLMFCIRVGFLFFKCREEQVSCINTDFTLSLEKMHMPQSYKILRLFLSLSSITVPVAVFLCFSTYRSTGKFHTATAMIIRYGIFFVCVFTSLRWWLNIVSPEAVERILKGNEIALTRGAFFIIIIMCIVLFIFPILSEEPWTLTSKEIYSESMGTFLFIVSQLLHLVAGDAISSAVALMSATILLYVILDELTMNLQEQQIWVDALIWNLLSKYWFYASAHQATFSSIQWDAAFLLSHKEINSFSLSGALVVLNTFSSHIYFGLSFPFLLIWSRPIMCSSTSLRRLHLKYILCFGIKLAGHVIAAFILRRHLMVVSIFCPKLIYEIIGLFVTMISSFIGHYFIFYVISYYHKLIRRNLGHMFSDKNQ